MRKLSKQEITEITWFCCSLSERGVSADDCDTYLEKYVQARFQKEEMISAAENFGTAMGKLWLFTDLQIIQKCMKSAILMYEGSVSFQSDIHAYFLRASARY